MDNDKVKADLKAMRNGDELYFNMFQDGGAMAVKVHYNWFVLFEIPLYGGKAQCDELYHESEIEKMIDKASSWT